jgi:hypothetical protein
VNGRREQRNGKYKSARSDRCACGSAEQRTGIGPVRSQIPLLEKLSRNSPRKLLSRGENRWSPFRSRWAASEKQKNESNDQAAKPGPWAGAFLKARANGFHFSGGEFCQLRCFHKLRESSS